MDNENVKQEWKKAGSDLGHAFAGLGKMLIRTAKVGMEKADEWANSDDSPKEGKEARGAGIIAHKICRAIPHGEIARFFCLFRFLIPIPLAAPP